MFKLFTWWNGVSPGGWFDIKRRSVHVGTDDYGNRYFEDRKVSVEGRKRRYVIYDGLAEPSKVPPEWHGWLHRTFDNAPGNDPLPRKSWEKPHQENLTGTALAYAPAGSIRQGAPAERRDYEAWSPE